MIIEVTNRELLRNYKKLKQKLKKGLVDEISIPQGNEIIFKLIVERRKTPFQELLEKVRRKPLKYLKRPKEDLFDILE